MDVSRRGKSDNSDRREKPDRSEASAKPDSAAPRPDEGAAETQVNLVSPFAHPRGAKQAKVGTFDLRQFVKRHPVPVALSCLALGGTIAAALSRRRPRDTWQDRIVQIGRIARLQQAFVDAGNGAG